MGFSQLCSWISYLFERSYQVTLQEHYCILICYIYSSVCLCILLWDIALQITPPLA